MGDGFVSLAGAFLAVICILVLAYWCSRILGKTWGRTSMGGCMRIVGQLQVGADRHLLLVKLQNHNFLIGVSAAGIQLLSEIEGELPEDIPAAGKIPDNAFGELFQKYASFHRKKKEEDDE